MIKNIVNKEIKITFRDEDIELPEELKRKINQYWEEDVKRKTPELWNGDTICISDYQEDENSIEIICKKSNYAHYIYDERIGLPLQYACFNLSAGCLLETTDGYYMVGELEERTSYPFCMQISGGNVDKQDIVGGKVDIIKTIKREVQEEINIDLDNKEMIEKYQIKYINLPNNKEHGYMIFAKGKVKMTAKELEQHYEKYLQFLRKNNLEIEFGKIHLISKKKSIETLEKLANPKREYLKILLKQDSQDKKVI